MTIEVRLQVAGADLSTYATARIERASTPAGFLADGASQVASINLVEGQTYYVWQDPAGTPASWYRTRLATAEQSYSQYSAPFQGSLPPLVSRELVLSEAGVAVTEPAARRLQILIDAVSSRIRRITRRDFAGSLTTWDEVYALHGADELVLRNGPVYSITSIRRVSFDGTEDDAYDPTLYRLDDAGRGRVRLARRPGYVRVIYTTTGAVPSEVPMAALEWILARWNSRKRDPALASYNTGDDMESYFASLAGKTPSEVLAALSPLIRHTGGGPI